MFATSSSPLSSATPRRRAFPIAIAVAIAVAVAAPPANAVPPGGPVDRSNGARVKLNKSKVKAGGKVKVTGRNWKAKGSRVQKGAQVTVKLDDLHIVAVLPIKKRKFSGWVRIPRQVSAGRHWLRFLAAKPATSIKSKKFRVTK